ncbi:MAG: TVP38/TMEM64 family protein [Desulfobulbaceae bacterium]|nr:TVP38/TMEM64 family protein [Desulfobulbaceae bacterium]
MTGDNKKLINRILISCAIIFCIVAFLYFDLAQYLSLEYLKASQAKFQALYHAHTMPFIAAYMGIYIMVTAMSLPGAAVLTLAGGGLFGLFIGTIIVSFASTIGGTLACIISRYLLRDWVHNKFGDKLTTINAGIEKEGAFYLFSLRLVPLFPFFVINLVMGLTRMPLFTYFWVSQLGMFAGTVVYVNAGKELAKIDNLSGILSPGLIISFALLGLFPITVKKLLDFYKSKITATITSETENAPE